MSNFLEGFNNVGQWIVIYGPTVIAVLTTVISFVAAIKKCTSVSNATIEENKRLKIELAEEKKLRNEAERRQAEYENKICSEVQRIGDTVNHIYRRQDDHGTIRKHKNM